MYVVCAIPRRRHSSMSIGSLPYKGELSAFSTGKCLEVQTPRNHNILLRGHCVCERSLGAVEPNSGMMPVLHSNAGVKEYCTYLNSIQQLCRD